MSHTNQFLKSIRMKTKLLFVIALFFALSEVKAQVSLPYYDGLNYTTGETLITPGTNAGFGAWEIPSFQSAGSSSDPFVISSPTWTLPSGLPAATGEAIEFVGGGDDPLIAIPDQGDTGVIYSSFVFRVTEQTAVSVNNPGYFYSFAKTASNGTSLNYTSCVYLRKIDENTFNVGVSENNNTTNAVWSPTAFSLNQDIFVVIYYDIDNAISKMWLNPVVNGSEPSTTLETDETATSTRTNLDKVRINLDSNARTATIQLDEVRIGNTWLEVTTSPTAGISDNNLSSKVKVYPNPANDFLNIETIGISISSVEMYNLLGKNVLTQNNSINNKIDISHLSSGIYLLKVNAEGRTFTTKIIKD